MATQIINKPTATLRDRGGLKGTIWKNSTGNGHYYTVEFSRVFKTEEGYRETHSFHEGDLLVLAKLASKADDHISELKAADKASKLTAVS